jgi:hypothetical protein
MRMSIKCLVVVALIAALSAFTASAGLAQGNGNGNGNSDHGCVTGNPSPGSECNGGPNDNQGKPGGGVGCAGGSNGQRSEPCGREDGDGTLNNHGNVPGCTSQGNAVNKNPHCGGGIEPPCQVNCGPPPCEGDCTPPPGCTHDCTPPPGGCVTNCTPPPPAGCVVNCGGQTTTTTVVQVKALPTTGVGAAGAHQTSALLWLLLAAGSSLAAGIRIQRRSLP